MMNFLIKRLANFILSVFLVALLTFAVFQIIPGDPATAILGIDADPAQIEKIHRDIDWGKPGVERFAKWMGQVLQGDLGESYRFKQPVTKIINEAWKTTAGLAALAILLSLIWGLPLGVLLAYYRKRKFSVPFFALSQIGIAVPSFCMGIFLIIIFCVKLKIFPALGYPGNDVSWSEKLPYLILPALALSFSMGAILVRYLTGGLVKEGDKPYVLTARSKGLSLFKILLRHKFRNALIPLVTIFGMVIADLLGGSIIIENVFALPGIGSMIAIAVNSRDLPLIQGLVLYLAILVVSLNFLVDVFYLVIDPRLRRRMRWKSE